MSPTISSANLRATQLPSLKPSTPSPAPGPASVEQALHAFFESATELQRNLADASWSDESWIALQQILESLPLTTAEFGQALNELNNAHGYARHGELGAAQYELRMLQRRMQRFATTP